MRIAPVLLLAGLTGVSAAGGKVVRVEQPPQREVFVPGGTFMMGIDTDTADLAKQLCELFFQPTQAPAVPTASGGSSLLCERYYSEMTEMSPREVTLSPFAIDRDEVTVAEYRQCIAAGACSLDAMIAGDERYIRDAWPMVNVTWDESQIFCRWRGGRLPTEAEWERAARGDDERAWPWGNAERPGDFNHGQPRVNAMREIDRIQSLAPVSVEFMGDPDASDGYALLAPPGTYVWGEHRDREKLSSGGDGPESNRKGTRDQAGNVAEWVADVRGATDAKLGYLDLPKIDPRRDGGANDARVVRGGSWRQPEFLGRANLRDPYGVVLQGVNIYQPNKRFSHVGFRCARSLKSR